MTVIGLINNNSKLSKDALSYKKENELILEKTANAVGRLSELLGAARMKTGSAGNDMIHGTAHLMRQLEELDASKALSAAELEDRIQKINSDLDFAKELLGYITKKDIAQNASLDELIRAKDALLTRVKELTAVDHQTIVASIAQEVADLTKELATLESLDQRIVEQKAAIANAQVIATAHADEKTGIDAKIAAVEKAIETLNEVLDTIETGDFSETEQLVENVENDSSNLQERVEELKDLIERTDAAKEELKRTLTNLQNVLGVETPTVTTGS
jgi:chromosome segregation ATPase